MQSEYLPYVWLGLIVIFVLVEALTMGLSSIWFAVGALLAFVISLLTDLVWLQITTFLLASILLLYYTRPLAKKYFKTQKTNADSLVGRDGVVIEDLSKHSTGQVKVWGQIWTAVSAENEEILKDQEIIVQAIEGVKLVVSPKPKNNL